MASSEPLQERQIGAVTVLFGASGGKYPQGNTLLVRGSEESVVIDPSLGMLSRATTLPTVDRVLPLAEAQAAHDAVRASEHFGKVVLQVAEL